jgi:hypothetical protein
MKTNITRRQFLKRTATAGIALTAYPAIKPFVSGLLQLIPAESPYLCEAKRRFNKEIAKLGCVISTDVWYAYVPEKTCYLISFSYKLREKSDRHKHGWTEKAWLCSEYTEEITTKKHAKELARIAILATKRQIARDRRALYWKRNRFLGFPTRLVAPRNV